MCIYLGMSNRLRNVHTCVLLLLDKGVIYWFYHRWQLFMIRIYRRTPNLFLIIFLAQTEWRFQRRWQGYLIWRSISEDQDGHSNYSECKECAHTDLQPKLTLFAQPKFLVLFRYIKLQNMLKYSLKGGLVINHMLCQSTSKFSNENYFAVVSRSSPFLPVVTHPWRRPDKLHICQ